MEEEASRYKLFEEESLYFDPRRRRKIEVRKKKKYYQQEPYILECSSKGILKRNIHLVGPDLDKDKLKRVSPYIPDEDRLRSPSNTKFDAVKKPWSSLKDQTKQSVITIPRRSRSLTEARQVDKNSSLTFKTRVTSALKQKTAPSLSVSLPANPSSQSESPSLMTTLTATIRNKAQRFQSAPTPQCLPLLNPPRIEITNEDDDPQKSILKSTTAIADDNEKEINSSPPAILHRVVTFSIPPSNHRRTSVSSLSSSTPDLRSTENNSRQSSFDSDDQEILENKHDIVISELLRQSPNGKSDIYYWIDEREKLMKEIERCLMKLRGVSRIIEEYLLEKTSSIPNSSSNSLPEVPLPLPKKNIPNLSEWQRGYLGMSKSYTFPYLCEEQKYMNPSKSWPKLSNNSEDQSIHIECIDDPSDLNDSNWDISMNRLSLARETSILSEEEVL